MLGVKGCRIKEVKGVRVGVEAHLSFLIHFFDWR
jgi:hypothetical protein